MSSAAAGAFAALDARIRQQVTEIESVVDRTGQQLTRFEATGDEALLDAVALNLHGFYTGVEQVLESIAREVDGAIPEGPNWHLELLRQMSANLEEVRPEVLSDETYRCLDKYRGFRHVVRSAYSHQLDPSRVSQLAGDLNTCFELVVRDLSRFREVLRRIDG